MKTFFKCSGVFSLLLSLGLLMGCSHSELQINEVLINYVEHPDGIDTAGFHFSWKVTASERNAGQVAYRIILSTTDDRNFERPVWDSDRIQSDRSILVDYAGPALLSGVQYHWKVKIWDNHGHESDWSPEGSFITGLFPDSDWEGARWISFAQMDSAKRIVPGVHWPPYPPSMEGYRDVVSGDHPLLLIRKEFYLNKRVRQAIVFVSGLGHYELNINGNKVGDRFLAPGWTEYDEVAFYNSFDVTGYIKKGSNAIGIMLGNGFYNVPTSRYRKLIVAYGFPQAIMKMKITFTDGSAETVISDDSWKWSPSPITFSSIFGGEDYNAILEQEGWDMPGFDDTGWENAREVSSGNTKLVAEQDYPVRIMERIGVKTISEIEDNRSFVYDFGQNASGIAEITVKGSRGDTVRLVPGELINRNGSVTQRSSGRPYYWLYVLKGDGVETWSPRFTYYGFRYVEVEGAVPDTAAEGEDLPEILDMKLLHNRNASPDIGYFNTSSDLFNRINELILWGIRSNLQSVVTDCPHREKLGWLEQTYLMGEGIHFNYDIYQLYLKLIEGMRYAQTENGMVPTITPEYVEFWEMFRDTPEWGSASVFLPWLIYRWYGDKSPMEESWDMMTRYVDYLESRSEEHIIYYGLGDWYDVGPKPPGLSQLTPAGVTATAIYYYDLVLMAKMAELLGKPDESKNYIKRALTTKDAFNDKFFDPDAKVYASGSQTSMAMPLALNMVEEPFIDAVFSNLVDSILSNNRAQTTGEVGFPFLISLLQEKGASDLLFEMNARTDVPGYGYQLSRGATALTESWQATRQNSNNHLMLGHIMQWFYEGLAGIGQEEHSVAYKEIVINPAYLEQIDRVEGHFNSPYGMIQSSVEVLENEYLVRVEIPFNSTATIFLPAEDPGMVTEGSVPLKEHEGMIIAGTKNGKIKIITGSGSYNFIIQRILNQ
ncbi:MAG: family 78 glycoside hydrolase catalytic domain [Bacteroidales bacterium]|nr:family 78 glycoside hydrolase catalytic domain [Bacteroidales bacterium]